MCKNQTGEPEREQEKICSVQRIVCAEGADIDDAIAGKHGNRGREWGADQSNREVLHYGGNHRSISLGDRSVLKKGGKGKNDQRRTFEGGETDPVQYRDGSGDTGWETGGDAADSIKTH